MTISAAIAASTMMEIGVSVWVNIDGLSPYPKDCHISTEKLSRKSLKAVSREYDKINRANPGAKVLMNASRSVRVIGWRFVRRATSSADGGGSLSRSHKKINNGKKNRQAETNGIQNSLIPQLRMTNPPTVLP